MLTSDERIFSELIIEMHEYIALNSHFIVNGLMHTGITKALNGNLDSDSKDNVDKHAFYTKYN